MQEQNGNFSPTPISQDNRITRLRVLQNTPLLAHLECVLYNTHVSSADVIRALVADGWYEARQRGSHKQFKHAGKPGLVTIPHPVRDLPIGTLRSIERQSGVTLRR